MNSKILLSVVSPVYKGEKMAQELVDRISAAAASLPGAYEIILVNDASPDHSWEEICRICEADAHVRGINLSRNFGQHYAITAGLQYARGEWVVVMDCDLQDRPEEIPALYAKAQEGFDVVHAQRANRQDSFLKRLSSKAFSRFFSFLTETKHDPSIGNFGIYSHKVIEAVLSMGDAIRNFPAQVQWTGFKRTTLPVQHAKRAEGTTGYTFRSLMRLATDTMLSFSDKPLRITVKCGFIITGLSILAILWYFIKWAMGGIVVLGYTSLIISVWFLAGVVISILGIVGLYIGRTFETVKHRPPFIVKETRNTEN